MTTLRKALLFVGSYPITRAPIGMSFLTIDSPIGFIVIRGRVEDTDDAYPHFLVEEYADEKLTPPPPEWAKEKPQKKSGTFDVFKVVPQGVELGPSRRVLVTVPLFSRNIIADEDPIKPTPNCLRVYLTTAGGRFDVVDLPLDDVHETVSHGPIRVFKVMHEDRPKSFFIEAATGGKQATAALADALMAGGVPPRLLPAIDLPA